MTRISRKRTVPTVATVAASKPKAIKTKVKPMAPKGIKIQGHPAKLLKDAGYEPYVTDATEPLEFTVPKDPRWRKGLVVGEPNGCTAAKGCRDIPEVVDAFILAKVAFIVFDGGDIVRYEHEGLIPNQLDNFIMTPPGTYRLNAVSPSHRLGKKFSDVDRGGRGTGTPSGTRKVATTKGTATRGRPVGSKTRKRTTAGSLR